MPRFFAVCTICLFIILSCARPPAAPEVQPDDGPFEVISLHARYKMQLSNNCSAGAALVMRGGKLIHENYFGTLDRKTGSAAVDSASRFPCYSISKEFGVAVLLCLVSDGLVGLDDPVSKYFPYFTGKGEGEFGREAVTVRQLASHTSGVIRRDGFRGGSSTDFSDVYLEFAPGTGWHYNELGMKILGRIMEQAGGKPYEQLLAQRILEPLGLKDVGFLRQGDPLEHIVRTCDGPDSSFVAYSPEPYPGSGLFATMRDIIRFGQLWLDKGRLDSRVLFDEALIEDAWRNYNTTKKPHDDYEYGMMTWLSSEENAAFMAGAAQSVAAILPDQEMIVLIGLNQYDGGPGWGRPPVEHSNVARLGLYLNNLLKP